MRKVYFDHSATTAIDHRVIEEMMPYFSDKFGNASSIHTFGREAKIALETAREHIARTLHANAAEIIFASGGTESDNLALKGTAYREKKRRHIITSNAEHHAVLRTCEFLQTQGFRITYLPVDKTGTVQPEVVAQHIDEDTFLISIMHANNEVGSINPIAGIGKIAREKGILFHTDAVQSFGKLPINVREMSIDMLSISAHKIHGPKGIGALYVRKGIVLEKLNHGGHHERDRRAGTENIPAIVGFGKAAVICQQEMGQESQRLATLRNAFYRQITENIPRVHLNGSFENRLPGNLNVAFEGIEGEALLLSLDLKGIAASSGSACTSGGVEPSHVLRAMGIPAELAQSSIRFSLGRGNSQEDVDYALSVLPEIVQRLRSISPFN
ncbi:cysteine desulfurase NifS [candidate division KSB1 bacterium]|nr:cysteine desulfurase NifS [candidate division KSB1 bacterium]